MRGGRTSRNKTRNEMNVRQKEGEQTFTSISPRNSKFLHAHISMKSKTLVQHQLPRNFSLHVFLFSLSICVHSDHVTIHVYNSYNDLGH